MQGRGVGGWLRGLQGIVGESRVGLEPGLGSVRSCCRDSEGSRALRHPWANNHDEERCRRKGLLHIPAKTNASWEGTA